MQPTPSPLILLALTLTLAAPVQFTVAGAVDEERILFESLKINGVTVKNVRVVKETPTEIIVLHDSGGAMWKRRDLPPGLKELYPYDAKQAGEYLKRQAAAREQAAEEARARQGRDWQRQRAMLQNRIATLEAELGKLNEQLEAYRTRLWRRRTAGEIQDISRLEVQGRDLKSRISEMRDQVRAIDRQLTR